MQVMHDNNITILCTALYHSSGFFIIMSPAEGLHFSALVLIVFLPFSMQPQSPITVAQVTMAAQPLIPLFTHIHHSSPVFHRDFFLLRIPIKINNLPSVIKMVDGTPVLHCPEVELSVQLVVLAQHVSTVLTEYSITLKGAYYDDNYPLYAIDLPSSISYEGIQSLLPAFSNVCYSITERYFSRVSCKTIVAVHLQLLLCSAAKDSFTASKVTSIQLGQESDE